MKPLTDAESRAAYTSPLAEVLSLDSEESILIGSEESINAEAQNEGWDEEPFVWDEEPFVL